MNQSRKSHGVVVLRGLYVVLASALLLFVMEPQAQAQVLPTRHVRQEVLTGEAMFLNLLPLAQSLPLTIGLRLRNEAELNDLLRKLYDPQSPLFHQFLSVQEFTERFGPTAEDYAAVVRFAEQNGLTVTGTSPNRLIVNVTGSVANIERVFLVSLAAYRHPTEAREFYGSDREPSVNLGVPLWHVWGLNNFSIPHPASLKRESNAKPGATGSGPSGYFLGSDMRVAYYGGTALTGAGQSVGLVEFGGYNLADVKAYFTKVKQPLTVAVTGISTDGSSLSCARGCDDTEQVLDIEEAISMAPGMSEVRVYVASASNPTGDVKIFNQMATDKDKSGHPLVTSLSCSWGWSPADPTSLDKIFQEFAAQGQTLFVASGDSGAYGTKSKYVYPADDAWVTSVGGTVLTTNGAGGSWKSETAWRYSGGGISPNKILIPGYQQAAGVITTANKGSKTYRNAPDVALEANTDNYICYNGTCAGGWGGTSFAAPRWAGYLALVNQQSVANGKSTLGFINPAIYTIGLGTGYSTPFHDITSGSNGTYSTVKGYDLVTGWGSPNGTGLINALAPTPAP
jgi:subtilase family serine protease